MERNLLLARSLLLPVLAHPGFEGLACGSIPSGEGERRNVGVRDGQLGPLVRRHDADGRVGQRLPRPPVKDVSGNSPPVLKGEGHVAAVVERLLKRGVNFFVGSERRNPALELLPFAPFGYFEFVRVNSVRRLGHAVVPCVSTTLTLVSIWMSGLKLCTGLTGSLSRSSAPLS